MVQGALDPTLYSSGGREVLDWSWVPWMSSDSAEEGTGNTVDGVIQETLSGKGNISSTHTVNSDEALDAGLKLFGGGLQRNWNIR